MPRAPRLGKHNGPMDEWLSHRSAKPSTAVRIRFGPQKTLLHNRVEGFLVFYALFYALDDMHRTSHGGYSGKTIGRE